MELFLSIGNIGRYPKAGALILRRIFPLFVVCCFTVNLLGQAGTSKPAATLDTSWVRDFASPSQGSQKGRENQLNGDPRFRELLRSSLPQHQFFWRDHGRLTSLPELVQIFMGVPGDVLLDQNRYVTIDGCVPHACSVRGMLWIDTAPSKQPSLIFVATSAFRPGPGETESLVHLWLYSSTPLWQKLPPQFLSSLTQWWNNTTRVWADTVPERVVLVTIVQPSGEMVDLLPSMFAFSSGAKK
jgi:hypothetical protein